MATLVRITKTATRKISEYGAELCSVCRIRPVYVGIAKPVCTSCYKPLR